MNHKRNSIAKNRLRNIDSCLSLAPDAFDDILFKENVGNNHTNARFLRVRMVPSRYAEDMPKGIEGEEKEWFNSYINYWYNHSNERVTNEY